MAFFYWGKGESYLPLRHHSMSAGRILSSGAGKSPPRGKRVTGFVGPGAPYESSPLATQREAPECFSCYMIQQGHPVTLTLYLSPEGRYHHLQRRRRCRPLSASVHNPSIQPAASAAPPLFLLAAKPLPQPSARQGCRPLSEAIHNPPPLGGHNPRGAAPSTLTPQVCPKASAATATF